MNESIYNLILSQLILRVLSTQNGIRSEPLTHRPVRCDPSPQFCSEAPSLASVLHSEILIVQHFWFRSSTWLRHRGSPALRLLLKTLMKQLLLASNYRAATTGRVQISSNTTWRTSLIRNRTKWKEEKEGEEVVRELTQYVSADAGMEGSHGRFRRPGRDLGVLQRRHNFQF